jgi:hypothetical protein
MNIKIADRNGLEIQFLLDEEDTLWFRIITASQSVVKSGGFMEVFSEIKKYNSAFAWVREVVIPSCNKILADQFGKDEPPALNPNDLISALRAVTYNAETNKLEL